MNWVVQLTLCLLLPSDPFCSIHILPSVSHLRFFLRTSSKFFHCPAFRGGDIAASSPLHMFVTWPKRPFLSLVSQMWNIWYDSHKKSLLAVNIIPRPTASRQLSPATRSGLVEQTQSCGRNKDWYNISDCNVLIDSVPFTWVVASLNFVLTYTSFFWD